MRAGVRSSDLSDRIKISEYYQLLMIVDIITEGSGENCRLVCWFHSPSPFTVSWLSFSQVCK